MRRPELAEQINPFEVLSAQALTEGHPMVARLIGRRFDNVLAQFGFERPFDPRFGKMMVKTLAHLCAALGASFGVCERTELSLFAVGGGGEARRLVSRICGEASAKLSLLLGDVVTFDTRLYEFDSTEAAWDYFKWRKGEAAADALDSYCAHLLVQSGTDPSTAPVLIEGLSHEDKIDLLRQNAIEFGELATWQRNGSAVYVAQQGGTGRLIVDLQLPEADAYPDYLRRVLA